MIPRHGRPASHAAAARGGAAATGSALLTALMIAMLALAAAVSLVPRAIGAVPLTVLTGSMRPALEPGDVVVTRPVDPADLAVGDVVTFQPVSGDPTLVTHRIVAVTREAGVVTSVTTRGDANGADDAPLLPEQVMGRLVYSVPFVGRITHGALGGSAGIAGLGAVAGIALIGYSAITLLRPEKTAADRAGMPKESLHA